MGGIYYTLSIIGMVVIVLWCVRNDGQTGTAGILAIKPTPTPPGNDA
jgi:hypothetical protein